MRPSEKNRDRPVAWPGDHRPHQSTAGMKEAWWSAGEDCGKTGGVVDAAVLVGGELRTGRVDGEVEEAAHGARGKGEAAALSDLDGGWLNRRVLVPVQ